MSNNRPRNLIVPALFGVLFYIFLKLAQNTILYTFYPQLSLLGISLGAIFLYALVIGLLNNKINLLAGAVGYKFAVGLFGIIIPISVHIYSYYFYTEAPKYNSILERDNIEFVSIDDKCKTVKYGLFSNGCDSIIRFHENGKDYQRIISEGQDQLNRIRWLNPCEYVVIEGVDLASEYVKLGNFEELNHYMYSKPPALHSLKEEKNEYIITLRTD